MPGYVGDLNQLIGTSAAADWCIVAFPNGDTTSSGVLIQGEAARGTAGADGTFTANLQTVPDDSPAYHALIVANRVLKFQTRASDGLDLATLIRLFRERHPNGIASGGTTLELTDLADTPDDYEGAAGRAVVVNDAEDGVVFEDAASSFLELTDTPDSYSGLGGQSVIVSLSEDGLGTADLTVGGAVDQQARNAAAAAQAAADSKVASVGRAGTGPIAIGGSATSPVVDLIAGPDLIDRLERILAAGSNVTIAVTGSGIGQRLTIAATGGGSGDDAYPWATEGNTDTIPIGKLGSDASPAVGDRLTLQDDGQGGVAATWATPGGFVHHSWGQNDPTNALVTNIYGEYFKVDGDGNIIESWVRVTARTDPPQPGSSDWTKVGDYASGGGGGDDAASWAEQGNTDTIPAAKLGGAPTGSFDFLTNDDENFSDYVPGDEAIRRAHGWNAGHNNRFVHTDATGELTLNPRLDADRIVATTTGGLLRSLAASTSPTTEFLRGDGTWEVPPGSGGGGDLETGLERVLNLTDQQARRSGAATSHEFTIPGALRGETIAIWAHYNITTAGTTGGTVGNIWLSTSDTGHVRRSVNGEFRGRKVLTSGDGQAVTTVETNNVGDQRMEIQQTGWHAVDGAPFTAFSSGDQTLYLYIPATASADADVRFDLEVWIARYSGEQGGAGTAVEARDYTSGLTHLNAVTIGDTGYKLVPRYGDILDRPINKVSRVENIPTPSASTHGHRYQTDDGKEYIVERVLIGATTRVVEFEAFPTTTAGTNNYRGTVNDHPTAGWTAADEGFWLVRSAVDQGSAPFVLVDDQGSANSISHIPGGARTFVHPHGSVFFRSEDAAANDFDVTGTSAVIYSATTGGSDWALFQVVTSSFVAGNADHYEYRLASTDLPLDLPSRVRALERNLTLVQGAHLRVPYAVPNWASGARLHSVAHGLASVAYVQVYAEALIANNGYAVGDIVHDPAGLYWFLQTGHDSANLWMQAASSYNNRTWRPLEKGAAEGDRSENTVPDTVSAAQWAFVAVPYGTPA